MSPRNNLAAFQSTVIRDAVVAGVNLNIFNQRCDRVKMANIAQTVNVLQSMVLTDKEKMVLTPTYHVFEMYKVHQGATLIPVELNSQQYALAQAGIPSLSASVS
jgi:alpha-N-arabinofuranosidase